MGSLYCLPSVLPLPEKQYMFQSSGIFLPPLSPVLFNTRHRPLVYPHYFLYLPSCIFTALKRSLGQGNVFTSVCHSVQGGGVTSQHASQIPWLVSWGSTPRGSLHPGVRVYLHGGLPSGRPPHATGTRKGDSYWNAFLLKSKFSAVIVPSPFMCMNFLNNNL